MSDRFEPIERLSSGATSTIYRAMDGGIPVALKVLHAHLAADPIVRARFQREGRLLATIRHPNIVRVYDVLEIDGQPAMVMELLDGGSLRGRIMEAEAGMRLLRMLCDALGTIHSLGIVHRDLRPEHILFDKEDIPRIVDFGMASVKDLSGLTRSTVFTASPEFVDPYTWGRGRALPVQDIYALGAILHTAIMGKAPSVRIFARANGPERERVLEQMRERAGTSLGEIITAMMDAPARRPRSTAEITEWIEARRATGARRFSQCLYCAAPIPADAPICLECGRPPLQIRLDPDGEFIALRKISEEQEILGPFLARLRILSSTPVGDVKLIIGDARLYSRAEQKAGLRLPVRLADGIHSSSIEPLIAALQGGQTSKLRISRYPMSRQSRVKRGPLMTLHEGRILPEMTRAAIKTFAGSQVTPTLVGAPSATHREGDTTLRTECRYAVAIATAALGAEPTTAHLADAEHMTQLWGRLANAVESLEQSFSLLAAVQLQDLYADLERLESAGDSATAEGMKERERLLALFDDYAGTEQEAAALEQRIVGACRLLEKISPGDAVERLREVEQLLGPQSMPGAQSLPGSPG